jgi:flagellar hook-associated protein 2
MNTPTFRASGIASGLDTSALINDLVKIEGRTIDIARRQQDGFRAQLSSVGDIISKLSSLRSAASGLGNSGVLAVASSTTAQGFTASASSTAPSGRYAIQVDALASAARARSQAFASASSPVTGGTLTLSMDGTATNITIDDGMTLSQLAERINRSQTTASATVLETNGQAFLSIARKDTGFVVGQPASSALEITESSTGSLGQSVSAAPTQAATNASVTIDGLQFERRSNVIADAVPGSTLTLSRTTTAPEDLVLSTNAADTQKNLQRFVDAFNDVISLVRKNLAVGENTDRTRTLGGDPSIRGLQSALQALVVGEANPLSPVRSLADVGIKTGIDGKLTIDASRLEKAIATDASAVNALFARASTGLSAATTSLVDRYTNGSSSILVARQNGIDRSIRTMDTRIEALQVRVDAYRERLVRQFTAMEKVVGSFKSIGQFLTSREKQSSNE